MSVEKCEEDKTRKQTLDSRQPSVTTASDLNTQPIHMLHIMNYMILKRQVVYI